MMTESTPTPPAPAPYAPPVPPVKQPAPKSRWAPWKARALRWTTGLLVVFALGLVATWLVQVQPLRRQVAALEQERASLQASVAELQAETVRLEGVDAENAALKVTKAELEQNCALLMAKVGTVQAQFVLASGGDTGEAAKALSSADDQLEILEKALAGTQQESVRALRYRLAMAVEEVESDSFAAQRDLEVLANGLETMAKELFGG
jgi:chromosome segregation ATPase